MEEVIRLVDRSGRMRRVEIRRTEDPEDMRKFVELQASAWGIRGDMTEVTPPHVLRAVADNSGLVIGAFDMDTGEALGFAWGFLARDEEGPYFYSHQTGVAEDVKYSGLGFRLKLAQRRYLLEAGMIRAKWTFDPLQGLNTRFNLGKLGVVSWQYKVNFYGTMTDEINRGMRSDRLKVVWFLDSERVRRKVEGVERSPSLDEALNWGAEEVLIMEGEPRRPTGFRKVETDLVLIEVPHSVAEVRAQGLVNLWREWTGAAMLHYFSKGYVDFEAVYEREDRRVFHLLWRKSLEDILAGERPG